LARLREQSGDYAQAVQNYQRSLAINANQPLAVERVAALNRQLSATYEASVAAGQAQIAAPTATYGGGFNNRF
jgi:hypothetical protein